MLENLSFLTFSVLATLVWAAPIYIVSTDARLSTKEKVFGACGTLVLSWIAIAMYTFLAPVERHAGDD